MSPFRSQLPRAVSLAREMFASVPSGEALFGELASVAPSSAGFFFDNSGRIAVNVVDPADGDRALRTVRLFLARGDIAVPNRSDISVYWRLVSHSYAQLARIRNFVFDSLRRSNPALVSLDLDEANDRVTVGARVSDLPVLRSSIRSQLWQAALDTNSVTFVPDEPLTGSARATPSAPAFTWTYLTSQADTMVGGLQIGVNAAGACTMGFVANYPSGGGRGFMTASHCPYGAGSANGLWSVAGFTTTQSYYGAAAGLETGDPPPWNCGSLHLCRRSDDAFYRLDPARKAEVGWIARPSGIGQFDRNPANPYFIIVGQSNGYQGQTIWSIGATSGWRSGTIVRTCVDHNLQPNWFNYVRTVRCTNESTNHQEDGDSGGPYFLSVGGSMVYLSGTLIGAGTDYNLSGAAYSTMSQMQLDFGSSLLVTRSPMLSTPVLSGRISAGSPLLSWSPVGNATSYNVYKGVAGSLSFFASTPSSTLSDVGVTAINVLSAPPPYGTPYAAYHVVAQGTGEYSANSNTIYFVKPAAITAVIQGQFGVRPYEGCYWTASVAGGTGTYTYRWSVNGQAKGTNSAQLFYANTLSSGSFTIALQVTDGTSTPGSDSRSVSVSSNNASCGG